MSLALPLPQLTLAGLLRSLLPIPAVPKLSELFPPILWAAPKKKTSHSKKRMRSANKYIRQNSSPLDAMRDLWSCHAPSNSICLHCYGSHKKEISLSRVPIPRWRLFGFSHVPTAQNSTSVERLGGTGLPIRKQLPTPTEAVMPPEIEKDQEAWKEVLEFKKKYADDIKERVKSEERRQAKKRGLTGRLFRRNSQEVVQPNRGATGLTTFEQEVVRSNDLVRSTGKTALLTEGGKGRQKPKTRSTERKASVARDTGRPKATPGKVQQQKPQIHLRI
ncbi:hypothetical protein BT69DRAFT_1353513 [Atractiella rhizophila]|nr:hypothetical protein BT69DRAFT_1353513 [Atractiella rhizophila]